MKVEPRGFEPLTSAVQRRHDSFPEVSRACKIPANKHIISEAVFPIFQDIHSGCCTVAAHRVRSTGLESQHSLIRSLKTATTAAAPLAEAGSFGLLFTIVALIAVPLGLLSGLARLRYDPEVA